jgi:hypothetical protein
MELLNVDLKKKLLHYVLCSDFSRLKRSVDFKTHIIIICLKTTLTLINF